MYRVVIFDLDGTLVQTEKLKAESYGKAVVKLSDGRVAEDDVIEAFREVVGRSRQEVSTHLLEKFDLEEPAWARMTEFDVDRAWQVLARVRLRIYNEMLRDPDVLRKNQWPHNVELLKRVRQKNCTAALATMSHCEQVTRILAILEFRDHFDFVASRDDVENPKPHPEIYLLVASELQVPPEECLVIEDSPAGVQAAQAAGMDVIAVTTPFTRQAFHEKDLLNRRWVVDDPAELPNTVWQRLLAHQRETHGGQ
jgi:HAD superfamily hydrolase (TIGR01509 family)